MFKNYLTVALRNLLRHKLYSFISLFGLAVGLACFIVIYLFVQYELSYDQDYPEADRIYRVIRETPKAGGSGSTFSWATSGRLGPALVRDFPEVELSAKISTRDVVARSEDKTFDLSVNLVNAGFFEMFGLSSVSGDIQALSKTPYTAMLTESAVKRIFGREDPIGKVIRFDKTSVRGEYQILGVLRDLPKTSTLHLEMVHCTPGSFNLWDDWLRRSAFTGFPTFIRLKSGTDVEALEHKMSNSVARYLGENMKSMTAYHLQPMTESHLYSIVDYGIESAGNIHHVMMLTVVGIFMMAIACINYTNLSTARSARRAREVGLRKVVGAFKRQLFLQFLGESMLLTLLAMVLGLALAELTLPWFSGFMGRDLALEMDASLWFALVGIWLLTTLLAGSYPAFLLSAFHPGTVLKADLQSGASGVWLRRGLVVFQFALSILLMISTDAVSQQLSYLRTKNLGYRSDQIIVMPIFARHARTESDYLKHLAVRYETVKQAFLAHPSVLKATAYRFTMGTRGMTGEGGMTVEGGPPLRDLHPKGDANMDVLLIPMQEVDEDFLDTFEIDLVAGHITENAIPHGPTSDQRNMDMLLTESAIQMLGWKGDGLESQTGPIGRQMTAKFWRGELTVVGVIEDFQLGSLHEKIGPTGIYFRRGWFRHLALRIDTEDLPSTIKFLEQTWHRFVPDAPFEFEFLDDRLALAYEAETRLGQMFHIFSGLAILVACLGLFGLAAFTAERRTKEIGVRKVLGASSLNIVTMLSKELLKLVVVANLIAWPMAYWVMDGWLQNFAYRTAMGWDLFVLNGILSALIALLTVGYQAVRASLANPVVALRHD